MTHVHETELALFATGDLSLWRQNVVRWHALRCRDCAAKTELYRMDRDGVRQAADRMPEGVNWDALSAEMTANIHLGIEAGECVSPKDRRTPIFKPHNGWAALRVEHWLAGGSWKPAVAAAGVTVMLAGAWWLNVPAADNQSLWQAFRAIANGGRDRMPQRVRLMDDRNPVLEVSTSGIAVRENGSSLSMSQEGSRPVAVSVSVQGSASAHYVDADTGQVTVTSVYVD